jgi:hypothetical protein
MVYETVALEQMIFDIHQYFGGLKIFLALQIVIACTKFVYILGTYSSHKLTIK